MNGIHDMGGRHGFGRVVRGGGDEAGLEPGGRTPAFGARWEGRVRALVSLLLVRGAFNIDAFRHAIERLDPVAYLTHGYYGRWLGAAELLVREAGAGLGPRAEAGAVTARREPGAPPRFAPGDAVRTRNLQPAGHTRLPAYARARRGTVAAHYGGWIFPDSHAHGGGEQPRHLYSVRFDGRELWGDAAEPGTCVHLDLFEPYLEPAP